MKLTHRCLDCRMDLDARALDPIGACHEGCRAKDYRVHLCTVVPLEATPLAHL